MQVDFSRVVQGTADGLGRELKSEEIIALLQSNYNIDNCSSSVMTIKDYNFEKKSDSVTDVVAVLLVNGKEVSVSGTGNGPISSFVDAVSKEFGHFEVQSYSEHSVGKGSSTKAATYVQLCNGKSTAWGIGMHESITRASVNSLVSAINTFLKDEVTKTEPEKVKA
ncbi:unnamed protein product [Ambrosiozyma monospora]|uniref:Unnamed protein product n=1 Tax=Ambrosiozyma monospora TaxID=43982 RepID=A0A9W6Z476_AMBMO|nr:unnamed protein product [Ambrosiozyma monospora]